MNTYTVTHTYTMTIEANSEQDAREQADVLISTTVPRVTVTQQDTVRPDHFQRAPSDMYGNPRYRIHWLYFFNSDEPDAVKTYDNALRRAKQFGGRKSHTKAFGGGIVFQSYNIEGLAADITAYLATLRARG